MSQIASSLPVVEDLAIKGYPVPDKYNLYPCSRPDPLPLGVNHGERLRQNKANLIAVMQSRGVKPDRQLLFLAMAMRETATMSLCERDCTKDADPNSANVSIFNANKDFIRRLRPLADFALLNRPNGLGEMVSILNAALDHPDWGVARTLNFHRGGETGARCPQLKTIRVYPAAIRLTMLALENSAALHLGDFKTNNRNIWIDVPWLDDKALNAAVARGF